MKHDLHTLRASLDHFDSNPHFGDAADVEAIKTLLALRIREAEHAQQHNRRIPKTEAA
jgi:hypothetical protein